jgi:hypothetical protein
MTGNDEASKPRVLKRLILDELEVSGAHYVLVFLGVFSCPTYDLCSPLTPANLTFQWQRELKLLPAPDCRDCYLEESRLSG